MCAGWMNEWMKIYKYTLWSWCKVEKWIHIKHLLLNPWLHRIHGVLHPHIKNMHNVQLHARQPIFHVYALPGIRWTKSNKSSKQSTKDESIRQTSKQRKMLRTSFPCIALIVNWSTIWLNWMCHLFHSILSDMTMDPCPSVCHTAIFH